MDHPHSLDNAMRHYERTITAKLQCIVVTESILTTNRCHSEVRNFISHISENKNIIYYNTHSHTHTTVLRPLYRSTGISRHLQSRTCCKVLLPVPTAFRVNCAVRLMKCKTVYVQSQGDVGVRPSRAVCVLDVGCRQEKVCR